MLVEPELTAVRFLYGRSQKFDRQIDFSHLTARADRYAIVPRYAGENLVAHEAIPVPHNCVIYRRERQALQHPLAAGVALESSSSWNPLTHSLLSEAAFQKGLPPVRPFRKFCPRPGQI